MAHESESLPEVYANRNSHGDFIGNALSSLYRTPCGVNAAVAFFTDASTIEEMVRCGCTVRLVVRLNFPTSPQSLRRIFTLPQVKVRYVTSTTFHPKMYIFGEKGAIVGSANLTANALRINQEVALLVERSDPRFAELMEIFYTYWMGSNALSTEVLDKYEAIYNESDIRAETRMNARIIEVLGESRIQNILVAGRGRSKPEIFTEDYERSYQEFLSGFRILQEVYESTGRRKVDESALPLRLEIDSFCSFVRIINCPLDSWTSGPLRYGQELRDFIRPLVLEWLEAAYPWLTDEIVPKRYPLIRKHFKSPSTIKSATDDELFQALCTCHAFVDQLHRVRGGLEGLRNTLFTKNEGGKIREVISYLIHGEETYITRMARGIYAPELKLARFGRAVVQELTAWMAREQLPICNGRTTKVMRFFGFDIQQIGDMG